MPDLHEWITRRVDRVEEAARDATGGPWCAEHPAERWGEQKDAALIGGGKQLASLGYDRNGHLNVEHIALHDPGAALRRCAADRKILARHRLDPDVHYEPACKGCGTYGDQELSEVDNLNECPELLDLAEAHGLTPEILATLDRPVPPPMPERPEPRPPVDLKAWVASMTVTPAPIVPLALRGPNWKGRP